MSGWTSCSPRARTAAARALLCQRGDLRGYAVPDEVDHTAADFNPLDFELTENEEFLGATDLNMPDPDTHPGFSIVHGTDKGAALEQCACGENR